MCICLYIYNICLYYHNLRLSFKYVSDTCFLYKYFISKRYLISLIQVESEGTVLSTNWNEVKLKTVEKKPPTGMEWKSWTS